MQKSKKSHYVANVAFATPSGRMHIGHGLGYTLADVILKYESKKQGKESFFGYGIHSTGKDLLKIINELKDEDLLEEKLVKYGVSEEERNKIVSSVGEDSQVSSLVEVYKNQYLKCLEDLGISTDSDSFFSTHQSTNQKYTQWTLNQLDKKGLIIQTSAERPYCESCEDIKHIDKDLSEVSTEGKVNWEEYRVGEGEIHGGIFFCRIHGDEEIIVKETNERAIDYGNIESQDKTIRDIQGMSVFPKKHSKDLEIILRTRKAKPFERNSEGNVGTISPFDKDKKVEALSDSNIYMEFYAFSQMLNQGILGEENLTDSFFDFILLNKGVIEDVSERSGLETAKIKEIKKKFEEIYPVDLTVAGFEHKEVHLPFSYFTHSAILPKKYMFSETLITSHVTRNKEKMSKSKGNVRYLDDLITKARRDGRVDGLSEDASVDAIRFFLTYYQSLDKDFDWADNLFESVGIRGIRKYVKSIRDANVVKQNSLEKNELSNYDRWFSTSNNKTKREIEENFNKRNLRNALITLNDERNKTLAQYLRLEENPDKNLLINFIKNQLILAYPVIPRISNELGNSLLGEEEPFIPSPSVEFREEFEEVEHELEGEKYVNKLNGFLAAEIGKKRGRGVISRGDNLKIVSPTAHQGKIILHLGKKYEKDFKIKVEIDTDLEEIEIVKG
jgi:leucyl-tRNA synthetase